MEERSGRDPEQMGIRKTNESEPADDASKIVVGAVETRSVFLFSDKSVGSLMTGQATAGVKTA